MTPEESDRWFAELREAQKVERKRGEAELDAWPEFKYEDHELAILAEQDYDRRNEGWDI